MGTQSEGWLKSFIKGFNSTAPETTEDAKPRDPIQIAIDVAIKICKPFEGLRLKPYLCPAGYPTIGYGTVYKPDGTLVKLTDPAITPEQADEWLRLSIINNYLPSVLKVSPSLIKYPKTLGAVVSFVYNLGIARYRSSTFKRRIDVQDWENAITEILKWNKGTINGRLTVLKGLQKRREVEASYIGT